uniref:EamA domain-containing protein n=1 Tax=Kalanchoe fedtschenkoi TaxID=63787 RepID=A0A7N0ZTC8_KALFE
MDSAERNDGEENHVVVEMMVASSSSSEIDPPAASGEIRDEITPLLNQSQKPKINIFSISYPRKKPRDQLSRLTEAEISAVSQAAQWAWNGSRYSGIVCVALSSLIYCIMEIISDLFTAQSIPLIETTFARCTIILILSYFWLRRSGQPVLGPTHARSLLFLRAVLGCLSLFSFIYSIQRLPLSQAIFLSFTTPVIASIVARIFMNEKLKISEMGGLGCSFFGLIFLFAPILTTQGGVGSSVYITGSNQTYAVLIGLFSAISGGVNYCLIRAAATSSEQPVTTVFSFGVLATLVGGICTFAFQDIVVPSVYSLLIIITLGVLAFFAEVLLARGFQLEKTSKVANIQFVEVAFSQIWLISSLRLDSSFGRLLGILLILISTCSTMYIGPDKETG